MTDRATDTRMIEAIARGDMAAFDEFYDRFSRPLYALGLRWLQDASDAEELVSDTLIRAWQQADRFDPARGAPASWLFGIARHVVAVALTVGRAPPADSSFALIGADLAPGASGVAELRPVDGGSVAMSLQMRGLPASKPGEFYELWWVGPDKRHVSCGTFRSDGTPVDLSFTSGVDITTTVLIEVTLEQDDGDATPGPHVAQSPTS